MIEKLQEIGLKIVSTVCDQGPTNRAAVKELCAETNKTCNDQFYFFVNDEPVAMLFDTPHLFKNTRNAMLKCNVEFRGGKVAKFEYIKNAFELDTKKNFRMLTKLKLADFNFSDSYLKMKVRVAAAQLSNTIWHLA